AAPPGSSALDPAGSSLGPSRPAPRAALLPFIAEVGDVGRLVAEDALQLVGPELERVRLLFGVVVHVVVRPDPGDHVREHALADVLVDLSAQERSTVAPVVVRL